MGAFEKFIKPTDEVEGDEMSENSMGIKQDNIDNDDEFDFEVIEEVEDNVTIEEAIEDSYELDKMNVTRVGEETIITGNIETKGHIDVLGTVKGNVTAEGNVALRSDIKGDVKGNNIGLGACNVTGDVIAVKNILTDIDSEINGNIKGGEISVAGQVTGTIKASKMIVFKKEAVMDGDIETDDLVVEPGAIINGKINITRKPRKISHKKVTPIEEPAPKEEKPEPLKVEDIIDVEEEEITDI